MGISVNLKALPFGGAFVFYGLTTSMGKVILEIGT
jgi:hypothetical protein